MLKFKTRKPELNQKEKPETENPLQGVEEGPKNPAVLHEETPEASAPPLNTSSPETNNEATHFDDLIAQHEEVQAQEAQSAITATMLTQEEFRESFIGLHGVASAFSGLQSIALPNNRIQQATANEIADTLYETILDIPMLHFILQPGNKWLGRGFMLIVYIQGMRGAVIEELRAKNQSQKKAQGQRPEQKSHDSGDISPDQAAALGAF